MYDYDKVLKPVFDAITYYTGSNRDWLLLLEDRSNRLAFEFSRYFMEGQIGESRKTWDELRHVTTDYIERLGLSGHMDPYEYAFALTMYANEVLSTEMAS